MSESKRIMLGKKYEYDWYFYHNALFIMTASAAMKWIEETTIDGISIKDRWLVPHTDINTGTVYVGHTICNSPECMSWNSIINADVKQSHDYHCVGTVKFGNKDTIIFSMKTPKLIARGIKWLIENVWEKKCSYYRANHAFLPFGVK